MNSYEDENLFIMDGIDLPHVGNFSEIVHNDKVQQTSDSLGKKDESHCSRDEDYSLFCSVGITEHKNVEVQQTSDSLEKSQDDSRSHDDYFLFCSTGITGESSDATDSSSLQNGTVTTSGTATDSIPKCNTELNDKDLEKDITKDRTKQPLLDKRDKMGLILHLPSEELNKKGQDTANIPSKKEAISAKPSQPTIENNLKKALVVLSKDLNKITSFQNGSFSAKVFVPPANEHNLKKASVFHSKGLGSVHTSQIGKPSAKNSLPTNNHNLKNALVVLPKGLDSVHDSQIGAASAKNSLPTNNHNLKNALVVLPKLNPDSYMENKSLESRTPPPKESLRSIRGNHKSIMKDPSSAKKTEKEVTVKQNFDFGENSSSTGLRKMENIFVKIHNFPEMLNKNASVSDRFSQRSKEGVPSYHKNGTFKRGRKRKAIASDEMRTGASQGAETDVTFVQERNLRKEADRNRETHTVDDADSDSDICIINENITNTPNLSNRRGRGRGRFSRGRPIFANSQDRLNYLKNHFAQRILKCSECSFKTPYLSQLKLHEAAHPKGRKMKCSKCTFETRIKSCMIYHAAMHSGGKKFKCSKCNFKTNNLEKFISHENKKAICKDCQKDCHTYVALKKHIKQSHKVATERSDSRSFPKKKKVEEEIPDKQDTPPSTLSDKEDAPPSTLSPKKQRLNLLRSAKNIRDRFVCKECRFPAQSIAVLREHLKNVHDSGLNSRLRSLLTGDKTSQSNIHVNSEETKSSSYRVNHHRRFRGRRRGIKRTVMSNDISDYKKTSYGEFVCRVCDFVSDDIAYFQNHLEIHRKGVSILSRKNTDIFKCTFCDFETEFETMLTNHLETHGEQDSDFDYDKDSPVKKDNNVSGVDGIGIVEHIEEKKYRCSLCDFQSNSCKLFERHLSLHLRRDVFDIIFSPSQIGF